MASLCLIPLIQYYWVYLTLMSVYGTSSKYKSPNKLSYTQACRFTATSVVNQEFWHKNTYIVKHHWSDSSSPVTMLSDRANKKDNKLLKGSYEPRSGTYSAEEPNESYLRKMESQGCLFIAPQTPYLMLSYAYTPKSFTCEKVPLHTVSLQWVLHRLTCRTVFPSSTSSLKKMGFVFCVMFAMNYFLL